MSVDFPINPSIGTTYSISTNEWIYDGYGWKAKDISSNYVQSLNGVTGPVGISAGSNITISASGNTLTISAAVLSGTTGATGATGPVGPYVISFNGLTGSIGLSAGIDITIQGSGNTLTIASPTLYGICGAFYASSLSTGLLYGGLLTINAGNTATFDVTAGSGYIVSTGATYNREPLPVITRVEWTAKTGVTLAGLTGQDTTWVYIDSTGAVKQQAAFFTDDQVQSTLALGALVHPSRSFISLARSIPNVSYATDKQYEQFIRSFGPLKVSGHTIDPNGANLKLNRTSGTAFILGRNYSNDPNNPSVVSDNAKTDAEIWRYYRGVTAGSFITVTGTTQIDPTKYDDGTGTLNSVSPSRPFTIQRVFFFPNTPNVLGVYYGRAEYASLSEAANNIHLEDFTEITNTLTNAVLAAFIIVKYNVTNLTTAIAANNARIIQGGQFRTTSSGGGSVATNLDSLSDVIVTSPQNDDLLIYDNVTSQWLNTPLQHIGVSRFNGLTGSVQGVSSIRGLTGTVGLTNGSGIGLSVSGNTLTVSNTGVLSIDGSTGAITNVAKTNAANTFNQTQSIEGSGSLGSSYLTEYGGSGITFNFDTGISTGSQRWSTGVAGGSNTTITFPNDTGTVALTKNVVSSFNGLTGAVTGVTTGTANTFVALQSFTSGISASGGVTFAGTLQGSTATFTGLVTSSVGFSGAASQITATTTNSSSTFYPVFVLGTGNRGAFIDSVVGPLSYIPSTATLNATNLDLGNGALTLSTTQITANDFFYFVANNGIYLQDSTVIQIGDVTLNWEGTSVEVLPPDNKVKIYNASLTPTLLEVLGGLSVSNGVTFNGTVSSDTGYRITSSAINAQTGTTYTLLESDNGKILTFSNASTTTVTVPTALPIGFNCTAIQLGAGQVGFTAASGVTLNSYGNQYKLIGQHASASIIEYTTNIVNLSGNLIV
jgi:hypothetical protein